MNFSVDNFLSELEILVNTDSGQGNPEGITAVGKFFYDRMLKKGWICEQIDLGDKTGKCTVIKNRNSKRYDLMLVGHIDTVFPKGTASKCPFRREGNKAYGLGTSDMKQGALAMLYVMEALPEKVVEALNIVAIFNPDEEIGSIYSKELIDDYAKISDYAFIFEAAAQDGAHVIKRKGLYRAKVAFHGVSGHAGNIFSNPGFVSAINELIYWAFQLNKLTSKKRETSVNVGTITGGEKHNVIPSFAEMDFELRYNLFSEAEKLEALLSKLKEHAKAKGVTFEIYDELTVPPLIPNEKTLSYAKHLKKLGDLIGIPFRLQKSRGGFSDANHIATYCPICVDGLAPSGKFCHTLNEYLDVDSIEPNLKFAYNMVCDLAKLKEKHVKND